MAVWRSDNTVHSINQVTVLYWDVGLVGIIQPSTVFGTEMTTDRLAMHHTHCVTRRPLMWPQVSGLTVSQKKQDIKLLPITFQNINRFSQFFGQQTQW